MTGLHFRRVIETRAADFLPQEIDITSPSVWTGPVNPVLWCPYRGNHMVKRTMLQWHLDNCPLRWPKKPASGGENAAEASSSGPKAQNEEKKEADNGLNNPSACSDPAEEGAVGVQPPQPAPPADALDDGLDNFEGFEGFDSCDSSDSSDSESRPLIYRGTLRCPRCHTSGHGCGRDRDRVCPRVFNSGSTSSDELSIQCNASSDETK